MILFQTLIREPLPPPLAKQDEVTRDQHFETTTGKAHDNKYPYGPFHNTVHTKAPGHWKVNYIKDLAEKVLIWVRTNVNKKPGLPKQLHFINIYILSLFKKNDVR